MIGKFSFVVYRTRLPVSGLFCLPLVTCSTDGRLLLSWRDPRCLVLWAFLCISQLARDFKRGRYRFRSCGSESLQRRMTLARSNFIRVCVVLTGGSNLDRSKMTGWSCGLWAGHTTARASIPFGLDGKRFMVRLLPGERLILARSKKLRSYAISRKILDGRVGLGSIQEGRCDNLLPAFCDGADGVFNPLDRSKGSAFVRRFEVPCKPTE